MRKKYFIKLLLPLLLISCSSNTSDVVSNVSSFDDGKANYVVNVTKFGSVGISTDVSILRNGEIVASGLSDNEGKFEVRLDRDDYQVKIGELPENYRIEQDLLLSENITTLDIKCVTRIKNDFAPKNTLYDVGDVVYNFEVVDIDGNNLSLSSLLSTKKAVILNFWGIWCPNCVSEMPFLEMAYQKYKDDIAIIAFNPEESEKEQISNFRDELNLTFNMVYDNDNTYVKYMTKNNWPTTSIIDRYGRYAETHIGGIFSEKEFVTMFDKYTDEDYVPVL